MNSEDVNRQSQVLAAFVSLSKGSAQISLQTHSATTACCSVPASKPRHVNTTHTQRFKMAEPKPVMPLTMAPSRLPSTRTAIHEMVAISCQYALDDFAAVGAAQVALIPIYSTGLLLQRKQQVRS